MKTRIGKRLFGKVRGFTLVELLIASSIAGIVAAGLLSLQLINAKTAKQIYGQTHMRSVRTQALDQIRYRLVNAEIGTVEIPNANTIQFVDPNRDPTAKCQFEFVPNDTAPSEGTLFFDDNIDDGDDPVVLNRGPVDITFTLTDDDSSTATAPPSVTVYVQSKSSVKYDQVDTQDGMIRVYLRNPPNLTP